MKLAVALALGAILALSRMAPAGAAEFTPQQRKAIEEIIHDYLTQNPDLMLDVLQAAQEKLKGDSREKAAAALIERRHELLEDPDSPVGGNPKGDVSLVEFFDYRCPYCKQVEPAIEALLGKDKQLRFVYKEFPVLGPDSVHAARAALAARKQGKYEPMHRALMAVKGPLDEPAIMKVAASVGLDLERLKTDIAAPETDRTLKANVNLAEALDIRGTPGFVIGDEIVPGAVSLEELKRLIEAARHGK
jgi:protein-disulfide isomerase